MNPEHTNKSEHNQSSKTNFMKPNQVKPNKATCEICHKETYPNRACMCPGRREDGTWEEKCICKRLSEVPIIDTGYGLVCAVCREPFLPQPKKTPLGCWCEKGAKFTPHTHSPSPESEESWEKELNKFYGAMFECGDYEALVEFIAQQIEKATEKGADIAKIAANASAEQKVIKYKASIIELIKEAKGWPPSTRQNVLDELITKIENQHE